LVLDLTRFAGLPEANSPFLKGAIQREAQWQFLVRFREEISKPIFDFNSHLDYVPTQVVAEFLTTKLVVEVGSEQRKIDGIVYGSAQKPGGKNLALFGDAARVLTNEPERVAGEPPDPFEATLGWASTSVAGPPALKVSPKDVEQRRVHGVTIDAEGDL
jgi:hypothetical protein